MSAGPDPLHHELDELLQSQSLGQLSEPQRARLEELVRDNPQTRRRYLNYMRIEAQLQWRFSEVAKTTPSGLPLNPKTVQRPDSTAVSRHSHPPVWVATVSAACVAAAVFLLVWIWWPEETKIGPSDGPIGENQQPPDELESVVPKNSVDYSLIESRYAAAVDVGGWYVLPTKTSRYEITSDNKFYLTDGEVYVARNYDQPSDPSFEIQTPAGDVRALGTRYIVVSETASKSPESEEKETAMNAAPATSRLTRVCVLAGTVLFANAFGEVQAMAGENAHATESAAPAKLKAEGNLKEALALYQKLIVDPAHGGEGAAQDLHAAVDCLRRLNRIAEWDALVEQVAASHAADWRVLRAVAVCYQRVQHGGSIIDNQFVRGSSGGRYVDTGQRDRIRSLQLLQQAAQHVDAESDVDALFAFFRDFASYFPTGRNAWRLQYLTDLTTLPDYGVPVYHDQTGGAPVTEDGAPVLHSLPVSWEKSQTDGQRWRWLLEQMAKVDPTQSDIPRMMFGDFLRSQFGVQTMGAAPQLNLDGGLESGPFSVHTLDDDETIARLATGTKRLALSDGYQFIQIYKEIATHAPKRLNGALTEISYKEYHGDWDKLPDFDKLKPAAVGELPGEVGLDVTCAKRREQFGMVFDAKLEVPADGDYTISLDSDDGSRIRVGNDFELVNDGLHGTGTPRTDKVTLKKGRYDVRVEFFEKTGDENLIIFWSGPTVEKQYWTKSREKSPPEMAMERLADLYQNRLQFDKAADQWRRLIKRFGPGPSNERTKKLSQIVDNWGRFEAVPMFCQDQPVKLSYVFRNGSETKMSATRINVDLLLADIKAYLRSNPKQLDHLKFDPNRVGERLVYHNQTKYLAKKPAAQWSVDIKPRPRHWDRRIDVQVPIQQTGAFLVESSMSDGNVSRLIVWITDTTIVSKPLHRKTLYMIADAKSGAVVPKVDVELFGYRAEYIGRNQRRENGRYYNIITTDAAAVSDMDGLVQRTIQNPQKAFQWLATVRDKNSDRFGVLGFTPMWHSDYHAANYQASKAYVFSDRPVYRPDQKVHFKAWVRAARYDMAYVSHFAGRKFLVEIHDPQGQKLYSNTLKSNEYGAVDDTITLGEDAALGQYRVNVSERPYVDPFTRKKDKARNLGSTRFRVEEYKKPEFEVTVNAPKDPAVLGDTFEATVQAKYYFGAPVTSGTVHYTIKRSERVDSWIPSRPWDWFYGPGYWWFGQKYDWYRGWDQWGCMIWPGRRNNPPEVVAENTVPIGEDGIVKIKIDSSVAKALFGHMDHQYSVTAEVTDESRRTIVGNGSVIAARKPFRVHAWMQGGHYRIADTMTARFQARRPDGQPVAGTGVVTLYAVTFDEQGEPTEQALQTWKVKTDGNGSITQQMKATRAGQFRIACELTSKKGHVRTGASFVVVTGEDKLKGGFRFNDLELVLDKAEYNPEDRVRLLINTNQTGGTVYLFVRPAGGIYRQPEVIQLDGKSAVRSIDVAQADMPNFFVEAVHVANGKVHAQTRKIVVPPVKRIMNVAVQPSDDRYEPGENAKVKIRLTDLNGDPIVGETVVSIYDKSIEYVGGGHPSGDIREFFWRWQRRHNINHRHSIGRTFGPLFKKDEVRMGNIGVFGQLATMLGAVDLDFAIQQQRGVARYSFFAEDKRMLKNAKKATAADFGVITASANKAPSMNGRQLETAGRGGGGASTASTTIAVRKDFADSAAWTGSIIADANGIAEIELPMPENLTSWKIHAWSLAHGTVVGSGTAEVITAKDLLIRLQAPRFFVQSDEITLSANVHNYLDGQRDVNIRLETEGGVLELVDGEQLTHSATIRAGQDRRVDWRVRVTDPGEAVVRMIATTGEASDAMEMKFPAYVHGMLKTDSYSETIRPEDDTAKITVNVPERRRPTQTHLEVRYSPSIALAMVDALPYLAGYEYKHSEAAISRFVPLAVTRKILVDMGVDLAAVKAKRSNLNPQEIGDSKERAAQWKKGRTNPVFDNQQTDRLIERGLRDLSTLQNSDGGWGWCPRSNSDAHSTAYVIHGLQTAKAADIAVARNMIDRGVNWLVNYQKSEVTKITNWLVRTENDKKPKKPQADNLDAFVAMILADAGKSNAKMLEYLDRDRTKLSVYSVAMLGLTFDTLKKTERRDMCLRNVKQYLVIDDENQSAHLNLGAHPNYRGHWRWYWYGSDIEAHAYFLKLLCRVEPKGPVASGVAKYLLNNRKHATHWHCTRDSALSVEALGDFVIASGESKPDMTVEVLVDGKQQKEIRIIADNLFTFDNVVHLRGDALDTGQHTIEIRRKGEGPVYVNAYLTNFTLEDFITKAGLEIKVERRYYKLMRDDQDIKATGSRGQTLDYRVEHFQRVPLKTGDQIASGDLVEVELILHSKNDYEHLLFEDFKPAGLEAVTLRSGWVRDAYMELRDEKVAFLMRRLPLGRRTLTYRLRAEIPGEFSALPTKGLGVYAPELRANSDEIKIRVMDQ